MKTHIRVVLASMLFMGVSAVTTGLACSVSHVATAAEITDAADAIFACESARRDNHKHFSHRDGSRGGREGGVQVQDCDSVWPDRSVRRPE
jgi:hypothetical protein